MNKLSEAEQFHRDALAGRRRVLGEEGLDTLVSMGELGDCLRFQGKFAEAQPLLVAALDGKRRSFWALSIATRSSR